MDPNDRPEFETYLSPGIREAFRQVHDMIVRSETLRSRLESLEEPIRTWEFSVRGQAPRGRRWRTATDDLANMLESASAAWREVLAVEREALLLLRAAMGKIRTRASGREGHLPLEAFAALEHGVSCHQGSVEAVEELLSLSGRISALLPEAEPEETCALLDRRRRHIEMTTGLRRDAGKAEAMARAAVEGYPPEAEPEPTPVPASAPAARDGSDEFPSWLDAVVEETSPPPSAPKVEVRSGFQAELRRALAAAEGELAAGEASRQEAERSRAAAEERAVKAERERDEALAVVATLRRRLASAGLLGTESEEDRVLVEEVAGLRRAFSDQQRELRRLRDMLLGIGEEIVRARTERAGFPIRLGTELAGV